MIKALNVKMFPTKDCQDIVDEIKEEHIEAGNDLRFVQPRESFFRHLHYQLEQFDFISHSLVIGEKKLPLHLVQRNTKFGLFSGFTISLYWPIEFLQIGTRGEGTSLVALGENFKWGIPNTNQSDRRKVILPFEFDDINDGRFGYYPVKQNGKWGLYDYGSQEMIIEPQYDDALLICEGLWAVSKNGKWGFVDVFNTIVIPFEYNSVSNFIHGYSHAVKISETNQEKKMMLDHNGNETSFQNENLLDDQYRGSVEIIGSSYAVGPDNEVLIQKDKYRYLGKYREGLMAASLDGKTYGFIDINDNIVIPFIYQYDSTIDYSWGNTFYFGINSVKLNHEEYSREWIIINHKNEQIFPYILEVYDLQYEEGCFSSTLFRIGNRFKTGCIRLSDLINYKKGKDMSYLIRTDDEMEENNQREARASQYHAHHDWNSADTWDAMTDGMYGDYPGGDVDYEVLGF
jgi:hypothetical protein